MKTLTVRLPDTLVAGIEAEARARQVTKSDIVRERLSAPSTAEQLPPSLQDIADLIGSVEALTRKRRSICRPAMAASVLADSSCLVALPNQRTLTGSAVAQSTDEIR
jgi:hypothetical protein